MALSYYYYYLSLCNIVSRLKFYISFVLLFFFEMVLLVSSDIETQPGHNSQIGTSICLVKMVSNEFLSLKHINVKQA